MKKIIAERKRAVWIWFLLMGAVAISSFKAFDSGKLEVKPLAPRSIAASNANEKDELFFGIGTLGSIEEPLKGIDANSEEVQVIRKEIRAMGSALILSSIRYEFLIQLTKNPIQFDDGTAALLGFNLDAARGTVRVPGNVLLDYVSGVDLKLGSLDSAFVTQLKPVMELRSEMLNRGVSANLTAQLNNGMIHFTLGRGVLRPIVGAHLDATGPALAIGAATRNKSGRGTRVIINIPTWSIVFGKDNELYGSTQLRLLCGITQFCHNLSVKLPGENHLLPNGDIWASKAVRRGDDLFYLYQYLGKTKEDIESLDKIIDVLSPLWSSENNRSLYFSQRSIRSLEKSKNLSIFAEFLVKNRDSIQNLLNFQKSTWDSVVIEKLLSNRENEYLADRGDIVIWSLDRELPSIEKLQKSQLAQSDNGMWDKFGVKFILDGELTNQESLGFQKILNYIFWNGLGEKIRNRQIIVGDAGFFRNILENLGLRPSFSLEDSDSSIRLRKRLLRDAADFYFGPVRISAESFIGNEEVQDAVKWLETVISEYRLEHTGTRRVEFVNHSEFNRITANAKSEADQAKRVIIKSGENLYINGGLIGSELRAARRSKSSMNHLVKNLIRQIHRVDGRNDTSYLPSFLSQLRTANDNRKDFVMSAGIQNAVLLYIDPVLLKPGQSAVLNGVSGVKLDYMITDVFGKPSQLIDGYGSEFSVFIADDRSEVRLTITVLPEAYRSFSVKSESDLDDLSRISPRFLLTLREVLLDQVEDTDEMSAALSIVAKLDSKIETQVSESNSQR